MADVKVFVAARGNRFMHDIAGWIAEAAASTGRYSEVIDDRLPNADGSINLVVAPHEFFELYAAPAKELQRAAAASICINTEQPGTSWFRLAVDACRRGLLTLDISPSSFTAPVSWFWGLVVNNQLLWVTPTGLSTTPAPLAVAPPVAISNATLLNVTLAPGAQITTFFALVDGTGSAVAFDVIEAVRP